MATTLRIRRTDGSPCDLTLRNGEGEKNHGGAIMRINGNGPLVEVWISTDDRKAIKGWL